MIEALGCCGHLNGNEALAEANDVRVGNAFISVKKTFDRR